MSARNELSDWMSVSGSRRGCRPTLRVAESGAGTVGDRQPMEQPSIVDRPADRLAATGPIDWMNFMRGSALLAILGGALWVEWLAIRSLAVWVSGWFGG